MARTMNNARGTFAALSYPSYRLWFFGQMTSLFGTWMQSAAQGYLVYELTHSAAYLGYVSFASGIAMWVFTLYGGVVADRVPRRSLLVVTQGLSMLLALVLSALTFTRVVAPWHILGLAFLLGAVNAFDVPARQSFVIEMVGRDDLTNAIALNSMMFNAAVVAGPAIGGVTYALFGPGWCFAINGVSFVAVIAALLAMRLAPLAQPVRRSSALSEIREGLRVVAGDRGILALVALMGALSLFGMSYVTLMPAWAVRVLHGDARTNGFLQSARGLGALAAAFGIASLGRFRFRGRLLAAGSILFPA
ncbi:MAG: MFS transporter, partial [Acidobacteria bacterium]|nr:MFS transporter [Acidobacteriota bacterium]